MPLNFLLIFFFMKTALCIAKYAIKKFDFNNVINKSTNKRIDLTTIHKL